MNTSGIPPANVARFVSPTTVNGCPRIVTADRRRVEGLVDDDLARLGRRPTVDRSAALPRAEGS
jgi:hypothetical protein